MERMMICWVRADESGAARRTNWQETLLSKSSRSKNRSRHERDSSEQSTMPAIPAEEPPPTRDHPGPCIYHWTFLRL